MRNVRNEHYAYGNCPHKIRNISIHFGLRRLAADTVQIADFPSFFNKGDNFCDFLLIFRKPKLLMKRGLL